MCLALQVLLHGQQSGKEAKHSAEDGTSPSPLQPLQRVVLQPHLPCLLLGRCFPSHLAWAISTSSKLGWSLSREANGRRWAEAHSLAL